MRNVSLVIALAAGTAIVAGFACGSSNQQKPAATAKSASTTTEVSSTVSTGTEFTVRLNTPVGTTISSPGQFFTAVVMTPLRSPGGVTVVPQGAMIRGRIVGADAGPIANVRLSFDAIRTSQGDVPLHATLSRSQPSGSSFRSQDVYSTAPLPYDAVLLPSSPPRVAVAPSGGPSGVGGGPGACCAGGRPGVGGGPAPARLELPVGTPIQLILTAPIGIVTNTPGVPKPAPTGTVGLVTAPPSAKVLVLTSTGQASVPIRSRYEHE
jgi:hypothetical protein